MDSYDIAYARDHLDELIARAARGEQVSIVDPASGTVRLSLHAARQDTTGIYPERTPGRWRDRLASIPDERLLAPLTEDELAWLSGETSPVEPPGER